MKRVQVVAFFLERYGAAAVTFQPRAFCRRAPPLLTVSPPPPSRKPSRPAIRPDQPCVEGTRMNATRRRMTARPSDSLRTTSRHFSG